jgi:response regulator of citrate/malate metabolism
LKNQRRCIDVVIITASSQDGIEEEARSLGVIDYLKKPIDIYEVERITSQYLN